MSITIEKRVFTAQEYLERERDAEFRSEYDQGAIIPMAGASKEHNRITVNISGILWSHCSGNGCEVFAQDMQVRVPECDKYYYPDIAVVCGEPQFEETAAVDVLMNPTLIIEVLSPSTEWKDRNEKFDCYETLESLTDYALISQTEPRIEHFSRGEDRVWRFVVARGRDAILQLPAIGCNLRLADVYARIAFAPAPAPSSNTEE